MELTTVIQQLTLRVETLEKRTTPRTLSPPAPQVIPTTVPMEIMPSNEPTHKRKAPADNDSTAGDWEARFNRLENKFELSQTHIRALEEHIEHSLHTIGSQVTQQLEVLRKAVEAQGKSLTVSKTTASAPALAPTPQFSQLNHDSSNNTTVWQWNCRGFARKRSVLQRFLTASDRPELIALQECCKNTQLAGFSTYLSDRSSKASSSHSRETKSDCPPTQFGSNFPRTRLFRNITSTLA